MRALNPLVSSLRHLYGSESTHLTTWTRGGIAMGRQLYGAPSVTRPPLPFRYFASRFLRKVRPDILILEYLELYPAWMAACSRLSLPVMVVDGRVTARSLRIRPFLRRAAAQITVFCAQTQEDGDAALALGVPGDRIHVMGNGKYDGFPEGAPQLPSDAAGLYGTPDVVIGSLHPDEEVAALQAIKDSGLRVLLAPRYLNRISMIQRAARKLGLDVSRRSQRESPRQLHLLDTYGELAAAYGAAQVSIVGGTFGRRGGQNLFEPALHNNVVIHGPNIRNIKREAAAFGGRGAYQVGNWHSALQLAKGRHPHPQLADAAMGLRGATRRHLDFIETLVAQGPEPFSAVSRHPVGRPL